MALNMIYKFERSQERDLADAVAPAAPSTIQPGVPVLFPEGAADSLTASGAATVTQTTGLPTGITSITYKNGGVGNLEGAASFAFDGAWDLPVTGAGTSTKKGVPVYITTAGALTLTESTNTLFGFTDYPRDYAKVSGRAVVRIGA